MFTRIGKFEITFAGAKWNRSFGLCPFHAPPHFCAEFHERKVFLFVNGAIAPEAGVSLSVKLPQSGADVLGLPLAEPMGYGMGKHGWVTLLIMRDDQLPLQLLEAWIDESYRAVAPKRLLAQLDELRQVQRSPDEQLP